MRSESILGPASEGRVREAHRCRRPARRRLTELPFSRRLLRDSASRRSRQGSPPMIARSPSAASARSRTSRDALAIDTIRMLAVDAVQKANSGHPGTPMALAPVAYTLWQRFLRYDPLDPLWPDRDRFVLSAGHASMLLYALLHLAGVRRLEGDRVSDKLAVGLEDIKRFRQLDSVTPGHPEYGHTTGVETTTGPLGQGCGNSVGMAIASRFLAKTYNKPDHTLFDFDVDVICSDGDMMEAVATESA